MRAPVVALLIVVVATGFVPAHGQEPVVNRPPDTLRTDSTRARPDTLSATERLLRAQAKQHIQVKPLGRACGNTVQPASTRLTLNRDSIDWAAALDLGELLARVPGVTLERGDWFGGPVLLNYLGHGAASVEYVIDCVPQLAMGPDSVAFDPSTTSLGFLDRVEVDLTPDMMRVYLFTRSHDRSAPRTKIGTGQGDRGAAHYFASYERRDPGGFGIALAADYVGLNAGSTAAGGGSSLPSGWLQVGYVPSPRFGIQAQMIARSTTRYLLLDETTQDTLSREFRGRRTDAQLRASWRARADGLGPAIDLFAAHSGWSNDSLPGRQGISQFGGVAALRKPLWSAQLSGWHYTRWTPLDVRLDAGWSPLRWLTGSIQVVAQRHDGNRESQWATARVGVALPLGFRAGGMISDGHRVQSPSLVDDRAQQFTDMQLNAGYESPRVGIDVGYSRDEGWRPQTYPEFIAIASLAPLARTDWLTAHVRIAPLRWFTLETVYQDPIRGGLPDGPPPRHALSTATLRSRFLHNFPSGIFELKLQGVVETWGAGIGGRDAQGVAIPLPSATFFRSIIQFQIGPFIAYYDRSNLKAVRTGFVPGYRLEPLATTYGIRWEFSN